MTEESASYVAGYVTKKMTSKKDSRLQGRYPEFARMSLKPGLGAGGVVDIARSINNMHGASFIIENGDVPSTIQRGKKKYPLGRYLVKKLREEVGLDEALLKEAKVRRWSAEVVEFVKEKRGGENESVRDTFTNESKQASLKQEVRSRIFKQRRTL